MAAPRNDNVKERILDVTESLMNDNGVANISLANIAEACGISKGTLYYHYRTKEDILFDLLDRYLIAQEGELYAWVDDRSKDTSLNRFLMYVLERNFHDIGPRFQLIYSACFGNEELRVKLVDRYKKFHKTISEKLQERDDFEPELAGYFAWMSLLLSDGLIVQSELHNDAFDAEQFIKDTERFLKNMQLS